MRKRAKPKLEISYLNTDLDLVSKRELTGLVDELTGKALHALHVTRRDDDLWYATFETDDSFKTPEESIVAMLDAIESLSAKGRAIWRSCSVIELNIGYDCGDTPWAFNQALSNKTLRRLGALAAALRITLYPGDRTNA